MRIKAFIFDLGNVIVPFEIENGLKRFEAVCGLPSAEFRGHVFGTEAGRLFETGRISAEEFFESVREPLGLEIGFEDFVGSWNGIFLPGPLIPERLLERLARSYRLLVLSDTNELHFRYIRENYPVLGHFDDFVLSYEVGSLKPSAEMFREAVRRAGCRAEECLFTDDKAENVEAAAGFGLRTVRFVTPAQFEEFLEEEELI